MSMLEARYFVAKISDAQAVLCDEELATLERLIRKVDDGRRANGKSSLTCVVVEEDWPNAAVVTAQWRFSWLVMTVFLYSLCLGHPSSKRVTPWVDV
ncbi:MULTISPECIES: hypothetical protein [Gammaproteobacteria]|uniref:hypothetical protein n=1 Tax=Gammaproteobacteria TaxID=1236 RepID=UPI000741E11C|nr:hypothetical protein APU07_06360 [Escherichia coli]